MKHSLTGRLVLYGDRWRVCSIRLYRIFICNKQITNYDAYNKGVGADGYSTMAELRMTVRVNFVNKSNTQENFESRQFSSSREYDASQQLSAVQDDLVNQMVKDIVDQIFNATVANW